MVNLLHLSFNFKFKMRFETLESGLGVVVGWVMGFSVGFSGDWFSRFGWLGDGIQRASTSLFGGDSMDSSDCVWPER